MIPRVLIVAGSDSGGGAGIQADIKTVSALGGYAMTAITALTAQNTEGVQGIVAVEPRFVQQQMRLVLDDLGADAVKTGMLHNAAVIAAVAEVLDEQPRRLPAVIDPVMVAKGGATLLDADAIEALRQRLMPHAALLTPNLPEAEALLGWKLPDLAAMQQGAVALLNWGAKAVLLKGGHLPGAEVHDVLAAASGLHVFSARRIETRHTHGTGCTLASAIATSIAEGRGLIDSVTRARAYLRGAILAAPGFGRGHGPLHHGHGRVPL